MAPLRSLGPQRGLAVGLRGASGPRPGVGAARQLDRPGAPACGREKRGSGDEALGRSRGGFSTKIHIVVDALGNPVRFILTPGQAADVGQGAALLEGLDARAAVADKGYDSDEPVARIERGGADAVIPPETNRKGP